MLLNINNALHACYNLLQIHCSTKNADHSRTFYIFATRYRSAVKVTLCACVRTRDLYGTSRIIISNGYGAAVRLYKEQAIRGQRQFTTLKLWRASSPQLQRGKLGTRVYHVENMDGKPTTFTTWKTPTANTTQLFLSFLEKKQIYLKAKLTQLRRRSFYYDSQGRQSRNFASYARRPPRLSIFNQRQLYKVIIL